MDDMIICRCEGVRLSDVLKSLEEGADSIPGVKKRVRVGMGHCQGRVCQQVVRDIVAAQTGKPVVLQKAQSPVRPVLLEDLL